MTKDFKFEFYRVVMPYNSQISFDELVNKVAKIPLSDRIRIVFDRPVYLYEISEEFIDIQTFDNSQKKIKLIKGMMIRVRTDDLPDWVDWDGSLQSLEDSLEDEDREKILGLGEKSIFLYNPETRIFIFQKTSSGASLNATFDYFRDIVDLQQNIQTRVCLNEEAMSRIDKLKRVSKFEIKIASLDSMEIFSGQDKDEDEINKLRKETRAPFMSLILSVEHQNTSLDLDFVKNSIKKWLPFTNSSNGARTDKIKLSGSTNEESSFVMDLIEDKMKESVSVKYTEIHGRRSVTDAERYISIKKAWDRRYESIIKMYMYPTESGRA